MLLGGTALVAAARALPIVAVGGLAAGAAAAALSVSLAPEQGGHLTAAAAENYSPVYRLRENDVTGTANYRSEGFQVLYRKDSAYHRIAVVQDDEARYLRFDSSFQSAMERKRPFVTPFEYVDYLSLALAYRPEAKNMLFVGLGGGSAPKRIWRDFPAIDLQVAELDPKVVDVAYKYFALPRSPRLSVEVEDGRRYLQKHDRRYDVIVLDAYYSDSIPFHLATREFMQLVRDRLNPGGVVVANVIGALEGPESKLFRAFYRTYRSVFPSVAVHPVDYQRDATAIRNIIVVAATAALPQTDFLQQRWDGVRQEHPQAPDLQRAIALRYEKFVPTRDVPVLTDDYAPTDALLVVD